MVRILGIVIAVVALGVALGAQRPVEKRILFIGNSFTYGNHMPEQLRRIAATSTPSAKYVVEMHVRPATTLAEHLAETDALQAIGAQDWDVVVLQDASAMSFRQATRNKMRQAAETLAFAAQAQGAEVLYFAHWAPRGQSRDGSADLHIAQTYAGLAERTGGQVAMAGLLWHLSGSGGVGGLYAEDDHHATLKGAYVTAMAFAQALGDVDPATSKWHPDQISPSEHRLIAALSARHWDPAALPKP